MRAGVILGSLAAALLAFAPLSAASQAFSFVAVGDTAYNPEVDYPVYEKLIGTINAARPAFSIHVGDTWGAEPCTEANHRNVLAWFAKYDHPVVYTPGDNEWADCRKAEVLDAYKRYVVGKATPADLGVLMPLTGLDAGLTSAGYDDPVGSLKLIRKVFFAEPTSVGSRTMPLVRQTDVSTFDTAENTRWEKSGVVFATVSVPGSNNGFLMANEARAAEAIARNRANVDWIKATFAEARAKKAPAVVIALQASLFDDEGSGGDFSNSRIRQGIEGPFYWIALAIRDQAAAFGKPVLVVNGDYHDFIVDRPFMVSQGEVKPALYANITRLQVYGAPELKAVKVGVDPATPWVFSFQPLY